MLYTQLKNIYKKSINRNSSTAVLPAFWKKEQTLLLT